MKRVCCAGLYDTVSSLLSFGFDSIVASPFTHHQLIDKKLLHQRETSHNDLTGNSRQVQVMVDLLFLRRFSLHMFDKPIHNNRLHLIILVRF